MKKAIIGKKVGMTQIFDEAGHVVPVTVIEAGPCVVVQKKTKDKEGYESVQLGFQDEPERKLSKPEKGHLEKAGVSLKKYLKEFRFEDCAALNVGDDHVNALAELALRHGQGWPEFDPGWDPARAAALQATARARQQRLVERGDVR